MVVVDTKELNNNLLNSYIREYESLLKKEKDINLDKDIRLGISTRIMFLKEDISKLKELNS